MAAIVHIGTGKALAGTTTSLAATYPTGYVAVADDVAVLQVVQMASNSAITTPAGYTLIRRTERTTTHVQAIYRRKLAGGTGVPTVVVGSASNLLLTLSIIRGVDTTTAEDATSVENHAGGTTTLHTGPDIGVLTTPFSVIMTLACTSGNPASNDGIVNSPGTFTLDPFILIQGEAGNDFFGGGAGVGAATCITMQHHIIPLTGDRSRVQAFKPFIGPLSSVSWIATTIALRPADVVTVPVSNSIIGAVRQQTPRAFGALCSTADPTYQVKLSVQVHNPIDGGDNDVWSSGADGNFWDLGQWSGPGRWQDITSRVRGIEWSVGADQPGGRPRVGTAKIDFDNADGLMSPWATTGTFTDGISSWFRTGALLRIAQTSCDNTGVLRYGRPMFSGEIESIEEHYEGRADAWISVSLIQPLSRLATHDGIEQVEQGGGEDLYHRIDRLLNDAGWLYGRGVGSGTVPAHALAATMKGTVMAGNRLTELYLTGDSAGVNFYSDTSGSVILNNQIYSPGGATFTNNPVPATPDRPAMSAQPYANNQRILNAAIAARVDGHEIEVDDGSSVSKFGRIDTGNGWPRRDLICQSDTTVAAILNEVLAYRAQDDQGVASIVVDCDMRPDILYSNLAFFRIFDNIDVRWQHPITNATYTQVSYVEALHHQITPLGHQMKWICTISLAKYPP